MSVQIVCHVYDNVTGANLSGVAIYQVMEAKAFGVTDSNGLVTINLPLNDGNYAYYKLAVAPVGYQADYATVSLALDSPLAYVQFPCDKKASAPPAPLPPTTTSPSSVKSGGGVYYLLPAPLLHKLWVLREKYARKLHKHLHPLI